MKSLKYSIIYAVIRPQIAEQLSVGLVIVDDDKVEVKYSKKKLSALKGLVSSQAYQSVSRVVSSLQRNGSLDSVEKINYATRYSNNLIAFSPLQTVETDSKDWLFQEYIYNSASVK